MFNITYETNFGKKKTISVIDELYALQMFKSLMHAIDLHSVIIIDGFTGEVLYEFVDGELKIINGYML